MREHQSSLSLGTVSPTLRNVSIQPAMNWPGYCRGRRARWREAPNNARDNELVLRQSGFRLN
jgi:hypothetical protein